MTDHLSWTYVFWINVPLGLVAMWLCNRALKLLPVRHSGGRIDYPGAALLTAAVTCALLVLSWGGTEYPWLSAPIVGLAIGSVVLFAVLVWQERAHAGRDPAAAAVRQRRVLPRGGAGVHHLGRAVRGDVPAAAVLPAGAGGGRVRRRGCW